MGYISSWPQREKVREIGSIRWEYHLKLSERGYKLYMIEVTRETKAAPAVRQPPQTLAFSQNIELLVEELDNKKQGLDKRQSLMSPCNDFEAFKSDILTQGKMLQPGDDMTINLKRKD